MTESEKRMHRVCFTGHRPEKLKRDKRSIIQDLEEEIRKAVADGLNVFICLLCIGIHSKSFFRSAETPLALPRGGADHKIDDAKQIHIPCYNDAMRQTITAKYRLYVDDPAPLVRMSEAYRDACNFVSEYVFGKGKDNAPAEQIIHDDLYLKIRAGFGLKSQMA